MREYFEDDRMDTPFRRLLAQLTPDELDLAISYAEEMERQRKERSKYQTNQEQSEDSRRCDEEMEKYVQMILDKREQAAAM